MFISCRANNGCQQSPIIIMPLQLYMKGCKYIRLKTLQLAYNFHFPLMDKLKLSTFQLAFSGYNLLTFTPYLWGDPETRASNAPSYPLSRTYSLSLKLGF